jgi:hypothetical protein
MSGSDTIQLAKFGLLVRGKISEEASKVRNHALVYDKNLFLMLVNSVWAICISETHLLKSFSEVLRIIAWSCH